MKSAQIVRSVKKSAVYDSGEIFTKLYGSGMFSALVYTARSESISLATEMERSPFTHTIHEYYPNTSSSWKSSMENTNELEKKKTWLWNLNTGPRVQGMNEHELSFLGTACFFL